MNWIKLVRRDLLLTLPVKTITHRYLLAVLAAQGYKVTEVPTPWHPRYSGTTKFGKKRLLTSAIDFVKLWWWFQTEGGLANRDQKKRIDSVINYAGVVLQETI